MYTFLKSLLIISFLCITISLCANNTEGYVFKNINSESGLTNNSITKIYRDKKGFVWVGTTNGLNRYNGYDVKTFKQNPTNPNKLNGARIYAIQEDYNGFLWVQTENGYTKFDYSTETFNLNFKDLLAQRGIQISYLQKVMCGKKTSAYFNDNEGVFLYNHQLKKSIKVLSLMNNNIISAVFDSQDFLWLTDSKFNIYKIDPVTGLVILQNSQLFENEADESTMYVDNNDNLWIVKNTSSLYFYDKKRGEFVSLKQNPKLAPIFSNLIRCVSQDIYGNIWIGTDHGGIFILNHSNFTDIICVKRNELKDNTLSENSITNLYADNEGIMWVGTYRGGLNYYNPHPKVFSSLKSNFSNEANDINCFTEDIQNRLLLGTNGAGLLHYNSVAKTFTPIPYSPKSDKHIIVHLYTDSKNRIWIGTFISGLYCIDGKKVKHYTTKPEKSEYYIPDDNVWCINEDSTGKIWIGTLNNGVCSIDDLDKVTIQRFKVAASNSVRCSHKSINGDIWFGTVSGINIINKKGDFKKYIEFKNNETYSSEINFINVIQQDKHGNYWIGTQGGVIFVEKSQNKHHFLTTVDGLPDNNIQMLLIDAVGDIWVSTLKGISKLKVKNYDLENFETEIMNFSKDDGLQSNKFNEKSGFISKSGLIYLGGVSGFNIINPKKIEISAGSSNLMFTDLYVNNKIIIPGDESDDHIILDKSLNYTQEVNLKYYENTILVEFASSNYYYQENFNYEFFLEGYDKTWTRVNSNNRKAFYSNLSDGSYKLKVQEINNFGIKGKMIELNIHIIPPFWRSWLAYLLYSIFILSISIIVYRFLIDRATLKTRIEKQVQEQKHFNELNRLKIKFFTNLSHDLRIPVSLIISPSEQLLKKTLSDDVKYNISLIHRNAKRLLFIVNEILDFRKIESDEMTFNPSIGDIVKFTYEASLSFIDLAEKKNIEFKFNSNIKELYIKFDPNKIERIFFNLLSNSFKFIPGSGSVCVNVEYRQSNLKFPVLISISDTGIGIAKEKTKEIFKPFFQIAPPETIVAHGTGIGLSIVYEFVQLHKGNIYVESELNKGTTVFIELPSNLVTEEISFNIEPFNTELNVGNNVEIQMPEEIESNKEKTSILIIEDNEELLFYLKENLKENFQVYISSDGENGYNKAISVLPDIIISDISMPLMDGIELCTKIKSQIETSHIPVILLTARTLEEYVIEGYNAGADDYITKPFNIDILFARIQNLLNKQKQRHEILQKQVKIDLKKVEIVSVDQKLLDNTIKIIEDNLSDPDFSVETLSKELYVTRVTLNKKLNAIVGKSCYDFIRTIRAKRGALLLTEGQLTVQEVAYMVGYNNPRYFTQFFKEEFNMTPTEYIRKYKQDLEIEDNNVENNSEQ